MIGTYTHRRLQMRKLKALCLMGMFLAVGACQDLDVPNINDPDRTRAIGDPRDVESDRKSVV